ncbi:hypothetical protein KQX54_000284 [Cotesia glomerata]|uniref:Uncharacterized protein n=1 Tax=Cotesia glomerata TaxID=32391 RepID=A0AAV7I5K5_COTGL|nr:hypothetical protein KQX54_000284 [Cotesia glomerata]
MFILKCKRDDSVCKVDDSEVIYNKDSPPKEGEGNEILLRWQTIIWTSDYDVCKTKFREKNASKLISEVPKGICFNKEVKKSEFQVCLSIL